MKLESVPGVALLATMVSLAALMAAVILTLILKGQASELELPAVLGLLGLITLIVNQLLLAFQAGRNQQGIEQTKQLVNGHLEQHLGQPHDPSTANEPQGPPQVSG